MEKTQGANGAILEVCRRICRSLNSSAIIIVILLDTYCKAGGAGMGYHLAGFEVVGVDREPQPRYPFRFIQADAVEYILEHGHLYDVIHASPPCQIHSKAGKAAMATHGVEYIDWIPATRAALEKIGVPYVIENVPFSGLRPDLRLFGYMFELPIIRERWFELGNGIWALNPTIAKPRGKSVSEGDFITVAGSGNSLNRKRIGDKMEYVNQFKEWKGSVKDSWSYAMGIDWMNTRELAQAIPPAYTKYIGKLIIKQLSGL